MAEAFRTRSTTRCPGLPPTLAGETSIAPRQIAWSCSSAPQTSSPSQAAVRRDSSASRTPSASAVFANTSVIGLGPAVARGGIGRCPSLLARIVSRLSAIQGYAGP
jgi:hypothetical protein